MVKANRKAPSLTTGKKLGKMVMTLVYKLSNKKITQVHPDLNEYVDE
jgi:hypothetical protein